MKKFLTFVFCTCVFIGSGNPAHAVSNKGFESLETFAHVFHDILTYYVDPPDEQELLQGAIRGLFDTLDPHSAYLAPAVSKRIHRESAGRIGGIGLEVVLRNGWVTVVAPLDGSPAAKAGIRTGDQIVKIDGASTKQVNVGEAVANMRGAPGSKITLTVVRPGNAIPFTVVLHRATVKIPSVRATLLAPGFPSVRITAFQEETSRDLVSALDDAKKKGPIKGLILDLRNNPGGLLNQAVAICDLFLEKGVIVSTVSRGKEIDRSEAKSEGTEPHYPIAILINGGSASASEVVTGALQDYRRAVVLGSQSFGKGSVQSIMSLDDGSALKLTIARYYTPKKRAIHGVGIAPDILVPEDAPAAPLAATTDGDYQRSVALKLLQNGTIARMSKPGDRR